MHPKDTLQTLTITLERISTEVLRIRLAVATSVLLVAATSAIAPATVTRRLGFGPLDLHLTVDEIRLFG